MLYSLGRDITFVVLALISSLAYISMHWIICITFFVLSIVYIVFEYEVEEYIKNA